MSKLDELNLEIYMSLHFDVICPCCGEVMEYEAEIPTDYEEGPAMKLIDKIYDEWSTGVCPNCERKQRKGKQDD